MGLQRLVLPALLALASPAVCQDVFPYDYVIDDLPNGLRLITVPTPSPGLVSVQIVEAVGSRDEVEEGKTGFAHFFEHMMFRGSKHYSSAEQAAIFKRLGAERNAYTTDDYTCYHTTFSRQDLETVLKVEADRFMNLQYGEESFRTEAKAVLGEYNTSAANPVRKLQEAIRETAFDRHTYRHTTMGFLRDIEQMPDHYAYSQQFFVRHYRPDNTVILVVGDVEPARVKPLVERYWGGWKGPDLLALPKPAEEPAQRAPRTCHVPWPAPTQPWVVVGFKGPAFDASAIDMPALDLLGALAFSDISDLYNKLFLREQKVDVLFHSFPDRRDPYLLLVYARVRDPADVTYVRREIEASFDELRQVPVDADRLASVKANLKYGFAASLDSPDAIASALVGYVARTRTPATVNEVYRSYDKLTPADLQAVAQRYFRESSRIVATLSHGDLPDATERALSGSDQPSADAFPGVLLPEPSPLVSVRLLLHTGAASDPPGKEGLAALTANLLARGATQRRSYEEMTEALFPMAASIDVQVDKEMTVFHGTVHRANLKRYYALLREVLLEPGFRQKDLDRVRNNTISYLDQGLRRSDDEELGKEVLYQAIYGDHPYGHHDAGRIDALKSITLDDVRRFYAENYTADRLEIGLAGGYRDSFAYKIADDLRSALPAKAAAPPPAIGSPVRIERSRMTIVQKKTRATGLHIGFPIAVNRSHPDWVALWLVRSWLGEHRSENSHLYQRLREVRGLNYGDYAYIEYFPNGSRQFQPDPNLARTSQIFQIWVRPVEPANGPFALKAAWYELDKLVRNGLTEEQFEATRTYLTKNVGLLLQTQDRRLGYALDSRYYGIENFAQHVRTALGWLTLDDVNRVLRRYLRSDRLQYVVVTEDAKAFEDAILADQVATPSYNSAVPPDVLAEDKQIRSLQLGLTADDITILPVEQVFR